MDGVSSRRRRPGRLSDLSDSLSPARAALALELRTGREKSNLSLAALARRTYSSKATVSRWLSGHSLPSEDQAICWAEVCGTDLDTMRQLRADAEPEREEQPTVVAPAEDSPDTLIRESLPVTARRARFSGSASRLRGKRLLFITTTGVLAASGIALLVTRLQAPTCGTAHPVILQIPAETGTAVGVTAEAVCGLDPNRTYLVVEKVPDVDPSNPHPAWYVKAQLPHLDSSDTSSQTFTLQEPVGTQAEFYVISVDNGGLQAINQNQVVDHGILQLPAGTRQESAISWHRKGWQ